MTTGTAGDGPGSTVTVHATGSLTRRSSGSLSDFESESESPARGKLTSTRATGSDTGTVTVGASPSHLPA